MLSVIIPAYNEEDNISRISSELVPVLKRLGRYEIIIVDDGSTDSTTDRAEEMQKKHNEVVIARHGANKGLGAAIITGINAARGDTTIMLDSDFTFHPKDIPRLLDAYKKYGADCVIGSPYAAGGRLEDVPFFRAALSKGVNMLYSLVIGRRVKSFSTIFRVYKTEHLKKMRLHSRGFSICAEILFRLMQKNRKIIEVPATLGTRIHGKSKINIKKEMKNNLLFLTKALFWKIGF